MRERYMKQVKKLLRVPSRKKRDILRDLEEAFASAAEHGETEQQVIDRLGTPEEFSAAMGSPADETAYCRQRTLLRLCISLTVCLGAFGLRAGLLRAWKQSLGIIGGADGPTFIYTADGAELSWAQQLFYWVRHIAGLVISLFGGPGWTPGWAKLLSLVGALAFLAALVQLIRLIRLRPRRKGRA